MKHEPTTSRTTIERPYIERAARTLSRQTVGLVSADHQTQRIIVRLCNTQPPKNWQGYPVIWRRANGR